MDYCETQMICLSIYVCHIHCSQYEKEERQRRRRVEANESHDSDEEFDGEQDMEFEGGFRVPGRLWNKLFRYFVL